MQSNPVRAAILVGLIAVAVVLFIVLQDEDSGDDTTTASTTTSTETGGITAPTATRIAFKAGKPVGGVQEIAVSKGETVTFTVSSDVAGEVHVHGYELTKEVPAGGQVGFSFRADLEGGYGVELHLPDTEVQIAELKVSP